MVLTQRVRDELRKQGLERGLELGREEGREEGLEVGLEKGREEGREEGLEVGLEKGREDERKAWVDWIQRRDEAIAEGRDFTEPPPHQK